MSSETTDLPRSIDIRSTRSIWLAKQLQFEDEPLTRTVERCLEMQHAAAQRMAQPVDPAPKHIDMTA